MRMVLILLGACAEPLPCDNGIPIDDIPPGFTGSLAGTDWLWGDPEETYAAWVFTSDGGTWSDGCQGWKLNEPPLVTDGWFELSGETHPDGGTKGGAPRTYRGWVGADRMWVDPGRGGSLELCRAYLGSVPLCD